MTLLQRLRRRLRDLLRGETEDTYFDLHSQSQWQTILSHLNEPQPPLPNLDDNSRSLQLARRLLLVRTDLITPFTFGLTPWQRGLLIHWFYRHGQYDIELTIEELLALLMELERQPDRGLVATFLVNAEWQRDHPNALTRKGWGPFKQYLKTRYQLRGRWFRTARLPSQYHKPALDPQSGINLLGHFYYPSGLQEAADSIADSLHDAGLNLSKRELPVYFDGYRDEDDSCQGLETFDITVAVTAINTNLIEWIPRSGLYPRDGVYRIAVWYWELSDVPEGMIGSTALIDEIWAPTRFIANAIRKHVTQPVTPMLPGVALPKFVSKSRAELGLLEGFLFLFIFDMNSRMVRKNPLGLIAAFRKAFARNDDVQLIVKVSRSEKYPKHAEQLRRAASDNGVTLLEGIWTRSNLLALMECCDCYVSLHRSEGLGLSLAEAMLLAKPVIATGYSGNLDFMNANTARLVRYEEVAILEDEPPYPKGFIWAEPSEEHAAEELCWVYNHQVAAREMGQRAAEHARRILAPEAAAKRMIQRLDAIRSRTKS